MTLCCSSYIDLSGFYEYYICDEDGSHLSEKHLPPLDVTGPAWQVADRWRKWKRAFE